MRGFLAIGLPVLLAIALPRASLSAPQADAAALETARKVFQEALLDEEHGNFAAALEKFDRVRGVRETAAVRYRMAACHERLGHTKTAVDNYERAARLAADDSKQTDIFRAATAKSAALSPKVPELTVEGASRGATVRLDGEVLSGVEASRTMKVDPGKHEIVTEVPGRTSMRTEVVLSDGAKLRVNVQGGDPQAVAPGTPSSDTEPNGTPAGDHSGMSRTLGWIGVGVGSAMLATSAVLLLLRQGEIGVIHDRCPGNVCPTSSRVEVESAKGRAGNEGIAAAVTLGLGAAALGAGIYFLVVPAARSKQAHWTAVPLSHGGLVTLESRF